MRELGAVAADHFDAIVVREDANLRGRKAGETASVVEQGVRARMAEGARCRDVELELDEVVATRAALRRANPGDLVVLCVDSATNVWAELEGLARQAQAGARSAGTLADPDL
jgi:cyanophycin synthetase